MTSRQRSERRLPLTIEIALLLSIVSVGFGVFSAVSSKMRNDRKDTESETEEKTATHTVLMTKLEYIEETVEEIKNDNKELKGEVRDLRDRVIAVEQSLKSYHKRLDGMKNVQ